MNELLIVNNDTQTVSARELHDKLNIGSNFTTWFSRMCDYGFVEGEDYTKCFPNLESGLNGGQNKVEYQISLDMAKQICMIQRTPEGKEVRQYLIDLEKAWNTPEQVMARALIVAQHSIDDLKITVEKQNVRIEEMRPKEVFADAVSVSNDCVLVGNVAKMIRQNGVDMGQNRFFKWLRDNGYAHKNGKDRNLPTQKSLELGVMAKKERVINNPDGSVNIRYTPVITGKGQQYFINKFLGSANGQHD